jgi:hypothetical protein
VSIVTATMPADRSVELLMCHTRSFRSRPLRLPSKLHRSSRRPCHEGDRLVNERLQFSVPAAFGGVLVRPDHPFAGLPALATSLSLLRRTGRQSCLLGNRLLSRCERRTIKPLCDVLLDRAARDAKAIEQLGAGPGVRQVLYGESMDWRDSARSFLICGYLVETRPDCKTLLL